jgi:pentatricopeptide repeat protein
LNIVIWVAAKCKDADVALDILHEMIMNEHYSTTPSIVTYNGVYSALASNGRTETIVETFQNMKHTYPHVKPNYMTYYHISRCLQKVKEEEERLAFLWRIYKLMDSHDRQMKIGSRILETLIQTYGALGHVHEAIHVFESISGLSDCACLRAIVFACSNSDPPEWKQALSYFHSNYIGKRPNYIDSGMLCNTMLACSKAGQWEESLQLLRSYSDQCMDISIVAINSLIAACGRAGRPDMSMEILYEVEGWGISLDTRSYRSAIIACNHAEHAYRRLLQKQKQQQQSITGVQLLHQTSDNTENGFEWWECAISLLRRMKESGIQPDTSTLSSTISACEAAGQWQYALIILQSAMDDHTMNKNALNLYCFNAAIAACEKGGAWVEALDIYESMKTYGGDELRPNIITISSLIIALDNAGQKEFALHIYREGIKKQYIPSPWRYTKASMSDDILIYAMDLHSYSAAMARAAIRDYMDTLVHRSRNNKASNTTVISGDCIIIVGQGYHSIDRRPILKDKVMNLLQFEYGIIAIVDETNFGRVRILYNDIQQYISQHQW